MLGWLIYASQLRNSVLNTATKEISFENFTYTDKILFQDVQKQPGEKKDKQVCVTECKRKTKKLTKQQQQQI